MQKAFLQSWPGQKPRGIKIDWSVDMSGATDCPYCQKAETQGEVFCSRHDRDMARLKSGTFLITSSKFELCDPHVTRLSLNFNLDYGQDYIVDGHKHRVTPHSYLLINEGQQFRTSARYPDVARMLTIAYQVGLQKKIYYSLSSRLDQLLDNPTSHSDADLYLFDRMHEMTGRLYSLAAYLSDARLCSSLTETERQSLLEDILESVLVDHLPVRAKMLSMNKAKVSTKYELYRRLHRAKEYVCDNLDRAITVDDLAAIACLSPFHFKRVFKEAFKEAPYQYIRRKRMEKAKTLLQQGLPVNAVCRSVGWEDVSSFVRLFRQTYSLTPNRFRIVHSGRNPMPL